DTPDSFHLGANRVPRAVAVADLNNDGDPDVITANGFGLSVLLGDGTGALGAPIHSGSGAELKSLSFGDIDGDGNLDTVQRDGWGGLVVQKGDGAGHFTPSTSVNVGSAVQSAVIGDVNADGKLDLVAASVLTASYYGYYYGDSTKQAVVILGDGQGNFALPQISVLGTTAGYASLIDVALADLTGDGLPELAVLDYYANTVIVASNDGDWTPPVELSISDVSVVEGHSGTVNAVFTVTLIGEHDGTASVDYSTFDYSESAATDYTAQSGSLSFGPGVFSRTITVGVNGDRLGEGDETFFVNLTNPESALVRDGQGVGTIFDDEPRISIDHPYEVDPLTVIEGDVGTTPAVFTVSLSMPYDQEVTVDYSTLTGHTADIIAASGTLRFAQGETSKTITVQVVNDLL
ncbi:MAG: FG-GAP-like repeat-containing protein, partial [Pirellulales bacterium]